MRLFGRRKISAQPLPGLLENRARDVRMGPRGESVYRHTFLRDEQTRYVLADILSDLGFFRVDGTTAEDLADLNTARRILAKLGLWNRNETIDDIVAALGNVQKAYTFGGEDAEEDARGA